MLPGRYNIATIIYDSVQQQRSVLMKTLEVPEIKEDPLPELARDLPRVEFLPPGEPGKSQVGSGTPWLPVNTIHPVDVELLFDVGSAYAASEDVLAANVISQIRPSHGCVFVSAIDTVRQETILRHEEASEMDWQKQGQQILDRDLNTIHVTRLNERQAGPFFRDTVQRLLDAKPQCPGIVETPRRILIVLNTGIGFVSGRIPELEISPASVSSTVYLRVGYVFFDNALKVLRPLAPHKRSAGNPASFRREVKDIMDEITQLGE